MLSGRTGALTRAAVVTSTVNSLASSTFTLDAGTCLDQASESLCGFASAITATGELGLGRFTVADEIDCDPPRLVVVRP